MSLIGAAREEAKGDPGVPAVRIVDLYKRYAGRDHKLRLSPGGFVKSFIRGIPWETIALNKVSLSVEHGEVFGLLGPNGSGKTTMIKILSSLIIPDGGGVYIDGINVVRNPYATTSRLQTVLADSIGLEKRLTAKENLRLFASLFGVPKAEAEERIDRLMDFFGLSELANTTSQTYSTGESRKLAVCRVLLSNASVIVFDEPTSGMDPVSANEFRRLILDDLVKREKKTILMATHNLAEATSMCTRIALLRRGNLMATGTPDEIRRRVGDHIELTLLLGGATGLLDDLREELSKAYGVISVEAEEVLGGTQIRVTGSKDMNYLEIFTKISASHFQVASLETSSPSLEDAFFSLTGQTRN